jgi:hypothetical protein
VEKRRGINGNGGMKDGDEVQKRGREGSRK